MLLRTQLRETGDKGSYRSAPALFGFLCDKYVQLARFFPNKAPARAELGEVGHATDWRRGVACRCTPDRQRYSHVCAIITPQLLTTLQDKLVPAVRTAVEGEDPGPVNAMLDELLPLLQA